MHKNDSLLLCFVVWLLLNRQYPKEQVESITLFEKTVCFILLFCFVVLFFVVMLEEIYAKKKDFYFVWVFFLGF